MAENRMAAQTEGTVKLIGRKSIELTGIASVESFDETQISLNGALGNLTIEGDALHITSLDLERGFVCADGRIDAVVYETDTPKKTHRLFGRRDR